jgi:hypothetical protein
MTLKEVIGIADAAYDDGLVQAYFEDRDGQHGDTLAKFIAMELADAFEPDLPDEKQIAAAIRVMTTAIHQIEDVVCAFEEAAC